MGVISGSIVITTRGNRDCIDLTRAVNDFVEKSGHREGTCTVFIPGSTAGITTIEYEPGLKKDIAAFFERIIPYSGRYHHHDTWHDDNGSSHLQAAVVGPSVSVPVIEGSLALGQWQQVVLVDFDTRPRKRDVIVQLVF